MTIRPIAAALIAALALTACSDSTAPKAIQLTDAQAQDLMDALSAVGGVSAPMRMSAYRAGPTTALATISVDQSAACPNGGTYGIKGSYNFDQAGTSGTIAITQTYAGCKATSTNGTLWTFNGAPNIATSFSFTSNATTGAFTMSGTEKGGIDAASTVGSGRCNIDITYNMSGNQNTNTGTVSISGSVCGRTISIQETM